MTVDAWTKRRAVIAWSLALGVLLLTRLAFGVQQAFHFSGPPVDGPFQLFNALRRIAAGQVGGVDFQFFHGLGVPYLHYPLFRLFGTDLVASELSRQILSIAAYPAVAIAFFWSFTRDWARTLALSFLVYVVSISLPLDIVTTPAVSLLGVRSTLPVLLPITLVAQSSRRRMIGAGVVIGCSLLIGTEQGTAAMMAFAVVGIATAWHAKEWKGQLRETAGAIAIAIGVFLLWLVLIGGPQGAASALRYNLKLQPSEQFWYFGVPASPFAADWPSAFALMRQMPRIPVALIGAVVALTLYFRRLLRRTDGDEGRRSAALAAFAIYALLSCASILGIFHDVNVQPCLRVLLLLGALEVDRWLAAREARKPTFGVHPRLAQVAGVALVIMLLVPSTISAAAATLHVARDHFVRRHPPALGGFWRQTLVDGQRVVDQYRGPEGGLPVLWSTYSGWLEARNGLFNPTPFDYAMHALGPANRSAYIDDFRRTRPTLVQTVLPSYVTSEIWFTQTSWELYEELLHDYRVVAATPWSFFWDRLPAPNPSRRPVWSSTLPAGASEVELPVANEFHGDTSVVLLSVQLDYTVHNPLGFLPLLGAMPRYFVSLDRTIWRFPVTLNPYTTSARFPVIAVRGRNPLLRFATHSLLPVASLEVERVQVEAVPISQSNSIWLADLIRTEMRRQPLGPGSDSTGLYRWR